MRNLETRSSLFLSLAIAASCLAQPAAAETEHAGVFDVYVRGVKAGMLAFSGVENDAAYSAVGYVKSTGLLAVIAKIRYDARSKGRRKGAKLIPSSYFEQTSGSRNNESILTYRGGTPLVKKYTPPREPAPWDVPPATQSGTLDPMSVLYSTLKDVPGDAVCNSDIRMFDGRRASRVTLTGKVGEGDGFTCQGEYRRIKGWHPEELAEKSRFPFSLTYAKVGDDLYRVTQVTTDTTVGRATLKRR